MANCTNCLTCSEWLRTDDPCVGLCRKLQHYTFQLEGDDCVLFEFGTARGVGQFHRAVRGAQRGARHAHAGTGARPADAVEDVRRLGAPVERRVEERMR